MRETIVIDRRFRGPPESANGGYACGLLAGYMHEPAEVTLRKPPPLERPLEIAIEDGHTGLIDGDELIGEAAPAGELEIGAPAPPTFDEAETAARAYQGFDNHPFANCFVCGDRRDDGLRIFPGAARDGSLVAAPWVPDASLAGEAEAVRPEFVWASLDCPGAWAFMSEAGEGRPIVLGRLAAKLVAPVHVRERHVVMGWPLGGDGRKLYAGTALYTADGELCALARATWVRLGPRADG